MDFEPEAIHIYYKEIYVYKWMIVINIGWFCVIEVNIKCCFHSVIYSLEFDISQKQLWQPVIQQRKHIFTEIIAWCGFLRTVRLRGTEHSLEEQLYFIGQKMRIPVFSRTQFLLVTNTRQRLYCIQGLLKQKLRI